MYTADIDIGGTFTDGFFTYRGEARTSKVLTTPHDLTECFINCLAEGAARFGVGLRECLRNASVVRLSTTLGTNTLIQRRGPKIGLLVTRGQEQRLYSSDGASLLGLFLQPDMVLGVEEEVDASGRSVLQPQHDEVLAAVRRLIHAGARMIAVSFAHSWRNPAHERAVRDLVRERYPAHYLRSIPLQLSHEASAAPDDHARTNAVVINAYLHQELARGLYRAEDLARENGMARPLLVVHASGGCARVAKTVAIQTLSSGPAVATSGATAIAEQLGERRVVTADMGGTSLDIALLEGQTLPVAAYPRIAGVKLAVPMIETESIGAGGGSIARIVDGQLRVGPESAGSAPGPACYDKGGMEPTVTDANLLLGFLDADRFLGGRMKLNRKRAEDAMTRRICRPLEIAAEEAAARVRAQVNDTMAATIASRLGEARWNPEETTLFAFGGGGPMHGCGIAQACGIRRVLSFPFGSVFSAFGSSTVDIRHQYWRNLALPLASAGPEEVGGAVEALREQAVLDMRGEGFGAAEVTYQASAMLSTAEAERLVALPPAGTSDSEGGAILSALAEVQQAEGMEGCELRTLILEARAAVPHWLPQPRSLDACRLSASETRSVRWEVQAEALPTAIYQLGELRPGGIIDGPAIVEAPDSSYAIYPGWTAQVDAWGNILMEHH